MYRAVVNDSPFWGKGPGFAGTMPKNEVIHRLHMNGKWVAVLSVMTLVQATCLRLALQATRYGARVRTLSTLWRISASIRATRTDSVS